MAETLFNELGLNKREAREVVDLFFEDELISLENELGEKLQLKSDGSLFKTPI